MVRDGQEKERKKERMKEIHCYLHRVPASGNPPPPPSVQFHRVHAQMLLSMREM